MGTFKGIPHCTSPKWGLLTTPFPSNHAIFLAWWKQLCPFSMNSPPSHPDIPSQVPSCPHSFLSRPLLLPFLCLVSHPFSLTDGQAPCCHVAPWASFRGWSHIVISSQARAGDRAHCRELTRTQAWSSCPAAGPYCLDLQVPMPPSFCPVPPSWLSQSWPGQEMSGPWKHSILTFHQITRLLCVCFLTSKVSVSILALHTPSGMQWVSN